MHVKRLLRVCAQQNAQTNILGFLYIVLFILYARELLLRVTITTINQYNRRALDIRISYSAIKLYFKKFQSCIFLSRQWLKLGAITLLG